jgi:hypothetical protein
MKVYCKIHKSQQYEVIAVCDEDILGKEFGNQKINEYFYKGDLMDISQAIRILKNASNFNIAGKCIIAACLENEIIINQGVINIDSIPFAMKFFL